MKRPDHWTRRARRRQEARDAAHRRDLRQAWGEGWAAGLEDQRRWRNAPLSEPYASTPNPYEETVHTPTEQRCHFADIEWQGHYIGERWCFTHGGHSMPERNQVTCPRAQGATR